MKRLKIRRKAWGRSLALLLLFAIGLAGCGKTAATKNDSQRGEESGQAGTGDEDDNASDVSSATEAEPVKIGFVVKDKEHSFWQLLEVGAQDQASDQNAEVTYLAPAKENDAQGQIELVKKLMDQKTDVICIAPVSDEMLLPVLRDAQESGIQIIAVDSDTSLKQKATFVGTDHYNAARAGAIRAAESIGENANAVVLRGYLGDKTHDARESGITDGLSESGVRVEKSVATTRAEAQRDTADLLSQYPSLSLIMTTSDDLTKGAYDAIAASGRTDVKLFGFDGDVELARKITANSFLIGLTAQNPYEMGTLAAEQAIRIINGEEAQQSVYSAYRIVDQTNVESYLSDAEALQEKIKMTPAAQP